MSKKKPKNLTRRGCKIQMNQLLGDVKKKKCNVVTLYPETI